MRTITFSLGGRFSSLVAPRHAAAFALRVQEDKAVMVFRLKRNDEQSALTSLNAAKKDYSKFNWRSVDSTPWSDTEGGVEPNEPVYYLLHFQNGPRGWAMVQSDGMEDFIGSQRDLASNAADLPRTLSASTKELASLIVGFSKH